MLEIVFGSMVLLMLMVYVYELELKPLMKRFNLIGVIVPIALVVFIVMLIAIAPTR